MRLLVTWIALVAGVLFSASSLAHQGMPNIGARSACDKLSLGDACEWSDKHHARRYVGSCRKVSTSLLCVRNKPIVYLKAQGNETHDHPTSENAKSARSGK